VLLKEIYLRVRNNLQIVQSLLSLQQRATDDSNVRKALDNSVRRIRSVALVHEMLYQSDDLSAISLPDYARRLVEELQGERAHIHFHLDIPAITVPLDNAVPLGLLLAELVGNSLQHAFARGVEGEVWIRVTPLAGNYIRLHVSDSGVGLENESRALPEPPGAVGLKLASALASQLGGLLKRQEAKGATFEAVLSLF
jgi:two-component sensor histidine kinase